MFNGAVKRRLDLVTRVGPNIDDLIITLTIRDDTLTVLLLDFADLFVGKIELLLLLIRNDHIGDSNGDARTRSLPEPESLQTV